MSAPAVAPAATAAPADGTARPRLLLLDGHSLAYRAFFALPADMATGAIPVQLGDGSQLAAKLAGLASLLTSGDLTGVTSLDLSVADRPTALIRR